MKKMIGLFLPLMFPALLGGPVGDPAFGQTYPSRAINFICPYPPGTGNDVIARTIGQKLSERFGQPVVVENRLGATGNIAAEVVARSAPDGYTIFIASTSLSINMNLSHVNFDLVKDFAQVALVGMLPYTLVVPVSVPAKSIQELIVLAKSQPGKLNYAHGGIGSTPHFLGEIFKKEAGIDIVPVSYKGTTETIPDLLGGRVQILFATMVTTMPHYKSGKLRILAVTGAKRNPALPDVPTMAEAGFPSLDVPSWFGVLAPAGTPKPIVSKLNAEIVRVMAMPDVRERLSNQGVEPRSSTPEEFTTFLKADVARWGKVVKDSGIRVE